MKQLDAVRTDTAALANRPLLGATPPRKPGAATLNGDELGGCGDLRPDGGNGKLEGSGPGGGGDDTRDSDDAGGMGVANQMTMPEGTRIEYW